MPETVKKKGRIAWLPILLGLLLMLASGWILWQIWEQMAVDSAVAEEQRARLLKLQEHKKSLEDTLALEPCAAKNRMFPVKPEANAGGKAWQKKKPAASSQAQASAAVEADADDIEAACVFLVTAKGNQIATGSGFFVAPGYVLTNRHVVENGDGSVMVTSKALGKPVIGKIAAIPSDRNLDCAIVQVDLPAEAHVRVLPFAQEVKKTQKVGAWGFPHLVGKNDPAYRKLLKGEDFSATPELSYTEGVISAILERSPVYLVHTAPISPGNSGGPLVNAGGEVTGINTQITLDEDSYRQASIAIAAQDLINFLRQNGIAVTSSKASK